MIDYRIAATGAEISVSLSGRLDFTSNRSFESLLEKIVDFRHARILMDMSLVMHVDSVGLGLLHIAREDVAESGSVLVLVSPSPSVMRVLTLTAADKLFEIQP